MDVGPSFGQISDMFESSESIGEHFAEYSVVVLRPDDPPGSRQMD